MLTNSYGQQTSKDRHIWEMHINVWAPKVANYPALSYPYMLKRNVRNKTKLGAWRATLSPFFYVSGYHDKSDTLINWTKTGSFTFGPLVQLGFEWQKKLGASMVYYGGDIGWRTRLDIQKSNDYSWNDGIIKINPKRLTKQASDVWLAGLAGMKHHIGSRISVSVETQIQLRYTVKKETYRYEGELVYSDKESAVDLIPFSHYLFNVSYNF
jgi:hypothetical protein